MNELRIMQANSTSKLKLCHAFIVYLQKSKREIYQVSYLR